MPYSLGGNGGDGGSVWVKVSFARVLPHPTFVPLTRNIYSNANCRLASLLTDLETCRRNAVPVEEATAVVRGFKVIVGKTQS